MIGYRFSACTRDMADGEVVGDRLLLGITSCGIDRCFLPAHVYNVKE